MGVRTTVRDKAHRMADYISKQNSFRVNREQGKERRARPYNSVCDSAAEHVSSRITVLDSLMMCIHGTTLWETGGHPITS